MHNPCCVHSRDMETGWSEKTHSCSLVSIICPALPILPWRWQPALRQRVCPAQTPRASSSPPRQRCTPARLDSRKPKRKARDSKRLRQDQDCAPITGSIPKLTQRTSGERRFEGSHAARPCAAAGDAAGAGADAARAAPTPLTPLLQPCSAARARPHRKAELIDLKELQGLCGNDLLPIKAEVN